MTSNGQLFFEIATTAGVTSLVAGFFIRYQQTASLKWPQAAGKIVTSTTRREYIGRGRYQIVPAIEYEFTFKGKLLRSSHWKFANFSDGQKIQAELIAARYSVGTPVTVYVNLNNPKESVLEHGTTELSWIPLIFGVGFLGLSVLALMGKIR